MKLRTHNKQNPSHKQQEILQSLSRKLNRKDKSLYLGPQFSQTTSSGRGWETMLKFKYWSEMLSLTLYKCEVGDENAMMLADLQCNNVETLRLCGIGITSLGLLRLLAYEWDRLAALSVDENNTGDRGMEVLGRKLLGRLKSLSVAHCSVSACGIASIVSHGADKLHELTLNGNLVGSKGAKLLIKAQIPLLQTLAMVGCQIGTEGAIHLLKSNWPNLKNLRLKQNKIGCQAYIKFQHSEWPLLQSLEAGNHRYDKMKEYQNYISPICFNWLFLSPAPMVFLGTYPPNFTPYVETLWLTRF